jgi:hypothetical protein
MRTLVILAAVLVAPVAQAGPAPVDFLAEARDLLVVGACAEGATTKVAAEVVEGHCKKVKASQAAYRTSWLGVAREFFKAHVPAGLPKAVVYPFAGGDLSTALTVFPDADEITTLSLEPAGDPRALDRLAPDRVKAALAVVASELDMLYTSNFSKTMNMIEAMRGGALPTQLIFSLSALHLHGYEATAVHYFKLTSGGSIEYLTEAEVKRLDRHKDVSAHNRGFGNVEIRFKKRGASREQVYRHIQANLDNEHLAKARAALDHLTKKGAVAAMTKAASYLLSYGDFSTIRGYLMRNAVWMVSDTTGIPPTYGTPAGWEYETYGEWESSNMAAGNGSVRATWKQLFAAQPKRPLAFRFGYPNGKGDGHLVIAKRPAKP